MQILQVVLHWLSQSNTKGQPVCASEIGEWLQVSDMAGCWRARATWTSYHSGSSSVCSPTEHNRTLGSVSEQNQPGLFSSSHPSVLDLDRLRTPVTQSGEYRHKASCFQMFLQSVTMRHCSFNLALRWNFIFFFFSVRFVFEGPTRVTLVYKNRVMFPFTVCLLSYMLAVNAAQKQKLVSSLKLEITLAEAQITV